MTIIASWKNPNPPTQETMKSNADGAKRFTINREATETVKAKVFPRQQYIDNTHEMPIPHWMKQANK